MAFRITGDCINCGTCATECPNDAVSVGAEIYVIDSGRCTECVGFHAEPACQGVCPVDCCLPDPDHEESEQALVHKALALHPDDQQLRNKAASNDLPSHHRRRTPSRT